MSDIDWDSLNDHAFVYLVGDLLQENGFTTVEYQGDGPDGGLDLFATQMITFGLQGGKPFRWGIQCKFSIKGKGRSVTDRDVYDIEGVMRSERYASQNLQGYMLVTNRRISQNVIERLRGVDRESTFRTSAIDGVQLTNFIRENWQKMGRYFSPMPGEVKRLGKPSIVLMTDSKNLWPPAPTLKLKVSSPFSKNMAESFELRAHIDIGADITCLPQKVTAELEPLSHTGRIRVVGYDGRTIVKTTYFVSIEIGSVKMRNVEILPIDSDVGLVGRDILKEFIFLWDGPAGMLRLWRCGTDPSE